jgi:hypothetical protein
MNLSGYVKKLELPADFVAPTALSFADLTARPLTRHDLAADLAAVNSSVDIIHQTRGGSWPEGQLTEDFDLLDLMWHEREFREATSLAYVVYDVERRYIGCFYLNPMGHSAELTAELDSYDVDVNWWVTADAYAQGYYEKLYAAVQSWLAADFPFTAIHFENAEIPGN